MAALAGGFGQMRVDLAVGVLAHNGGTLAVEVEGDVRAQV